MGNPLTTTLPIGTQFSMVRSSDGVPIDLLVEPGGSSSIDASAVTYTPADPTDWTLPPPNDVADALDQLANVRGSYVDNPALLPSASVQILTLNGVQPTKSGVYLVWVAATMTSSAPSVAGGLARASLAVDSVSQGQHLDVGFAPGSWVATVSNFLLIAVNRAVPHNWSLILDTAGGDAFTVGAQQAKLMLLEL